MLGSTLVVGSCGTTRDGFAPSPGSTSDFSSGDGSASDPDADTTYMASQWNAEAVPRAMLVLIGRSGSMGGEKWDAATKAVRAFADRSEVVGMKMGLQFFPPIGTTSDQCSPAAYQNLAVPIAALPDNVLPIQ